MTTPTQTDWRQLAEKRWPTAARSGHIYGSGPFCIAVACSKKVFLFESKEKRARKMYSMDYSCGASSCSGAHTYADLLCTGPPALRSRAV